jgi:acyl carrier protein
MEQELKALIIECLRLEGRTPESIASDEPLFGEGLGLDSIDALELALEIRKRFGVRASASEEENRRIFATVGSLAAYITQRRAEQVG